MSCVQKTSEEAGVGLIQQRRSEEPLPLHFTTKECKMATDGRANSMAATARGAAALTLPDPLTLTSLQLIGSVGPLALLLMMILLPLVFRA